MAINRNAAVLRIRYRTTALLIATTLQVSSLEADSPNYYTVTQVNPSTQQIDGAVAVDPNGADFDGLLFSRATVDFETLRLQRDVSWYTPAGGFNKKYEHIRVEGNDKNVDSLTVYSQTPLDTDCFFYDLKVRSLALDNASFVLSDQESGAPNEAGCERPIDFYVTSNSNAVATEVIMENGILDLNARQLLVEGVPLTVAAINGVNTIRSPASESFAANPLQVRIEPGATLQIIPEPGLTRLSTSPEIDVNNSHFDVFGDLADGNLVWGLAARSGQNFVVSNGGNLRVGNGSTTFRFGLEFAADEGIQVSDSTVEVTSFATLSSPLLLNDSNVNISASGHLVAEMLRSSGDSLVIAAPAAVESKIGGLKVSSGTLVISGGQTLIENADSFSQVLGTLQLGRSGDPELPRLHFPGAESRNPLTPDPELFFSNGSRLTGEAIVTMNADAHALFFENGSTLDPGHSLGTLGMDGQLFMEDGSVFAAELDLSSVSSGQISSDKVELTAPFGYLSLGLGNGTVLDLTLFNDTPLPAGAKARLITYPSASDWNGATFSGLPNGAVFQSGSNWWQINYDEPLVPGLEDLVPILTVTLTVVASNLEVTPTVTNFGPQLENTSGAERIITLRNSGLAPLDITSVAGSNTDYAKTTDNCSGGTLSGGAACTIGFVFTPTVAGADISDLLVNGQIVGALVGEGVPGVSNGVSLTPNFLGFGEVDVNVVAGPQTIVLANASGVELNPLTFLILGSTQFTQTNDCGSSLADGSECTLQVSFSPTVEGLDGAVLRAFDKGVLIAEAALTGTGITEPLVALAPGTLDFGNQSVGAASAPQPFNVQNNGTADLLVSSLNSSSPDYSFISDHCTGMVVAPNGSCTVEVVFTPSRVGSDPAGISVLSNATSSPDTLDLAGTGLGPELSLNRSSILFSSQTQGVPSAPETVVITNTGNAPLDITTVVSSAAEFTTDGGSCSGQSIAAGASCSFDVILTGDALHLASGVISISSNAPTSVDTVQVSGLVRGVLPANFLVTKRYTDGATHPVRVQLSCNNGLPLTQSFEIAPGKPVRFVLEHFSPAETRCEVSEGIPPEGYAPVYDNGISFSTFSCQYQHLESGAEYSCRITNEAQPALFSISKEWLMPGLDDDMELPDVAVNVACTSDILSIDGVPQADPSNSAYFLLADGETRELRVDTTWGDTQCSATETVYVSGVEMSSEGCTESEMGAGDEKRCVFTNTMFLEGIPVLNPYGLAVMALLMLGIGLIGMRRLV